MQHFYILWSQLRNGDPDLSEQPGSLSMLLLSLQPEQNNPLPLKPLMIMKMLMGSGGPAALEFTGALLSYDCNIRKNEGVIGDGVFLDTVSNKGWDMNFIKLQHYLIGHFLFKTSTLSIIGEQNKTFFYFCDIFLFCNLCTLINKVPSLIQFTSVFKHFQDILIRKICWRS